MLQAGKNITSPKDNLQKVDLSYLHKAIKTPKTQLKEFIEQLRKLRTIDEDQYRRQKRHLPYITTGIFKPPFRKTENFAVVHHFIIDLDHISENELDINQLKNELSQDKRIALMFASPGNDGLKLIFNLEPSCYDHGKYSRFYKTFARQFAQNHKLETVVDMNTSDVTRACFFSYDPDAWYNPEAKAISMDDFLDFSNPYEIRQTEKSNKKFEQEVKDQQTGYNTDTQAKQYIEKDVLTDIKKTLNPNYREKPPKNIYTPEETENILDELKELLEAHQLKLSEVTNINYGKKLRIELGYRWAEINLFYGKRGYSLVKTPKRGSDKELTDVAHQVLAEKIYGTV
ncbi:MAG: CRISPR-associated primase-polymerase type B [Bacteroidota bacterium]